MVIKPIYTNNLLDELLKSLAAIPHEKRVLICDHHTKNHCLPLIANVKLDEIIAVKPGEGSKSLDVYQKITNQLLEINADKKTLLIALGGGVVTDLTGFVASTFKRGIKYINIPTTLLGMVDAAIGGKTGINHNGIKNCIGSMHFPSSIISSAKFLETLDHTELLSGYGEVIKHCLIKNIDLPNTNAQITNEKLVEWANVKSTIVEQDVYEKDIRFILNAGHTIAHGIESQMLAKQTPIPHGKAVVYGLWAESLLAKTIINNEKHLEVLQKYVPQYYGQLELNQEDISKIMSFILNDKKNENDKIKCSLLSDEGQLNLSIIKKEEIQRALELLFL